MQLRRISLVLLCALGWLSGTLHANLEAADWILDHHHHGHAHHHHHGSDGTDTHGATDNDEHVPVWARDGARISIPALLGVFLGLLVLFLLRRVALAHVALLCSRTLSCEPPPGLTWQFVQRCAVPSTAPPALN